MEWKRGPVIGRGSSAAVSLATSDAGDIFAVKSAKMSSSSSLRNEQILISQLSSPFIVKCLGSDITRERDEFVFNIFLEYVSGGTLSDLIRSNGGSLDETTIKFYANQMAEGLNYLHRAGIVHCDIKGQNVLIADRGGLKIADFGCAKRAESGGSVFAGTPVYMAPEVARGEGQGFPADVWAMGCTIIEMATGENPWPEMNDPTAALYRVAFSCDVPEIPRWFSGAARDFAAKCFARDPEKRWTAEKLLGHPFLDSAEGGVGKSTKKSPTSVMDQCFWDTLEVPDWTTENASTSDSPAARIGGLIGDGLNSDYSAAAVGEEGWVTVRGGATEEGTNMNIVELIEIEDTLFRLN
ncbi:hypothetical protein SASPL_139251 [Salvia splendens]|uniref:Protein kinase domain-containing protein n=1 Tax=Salvia splendens TaxID=180675 RepID=A0A8X8WPC9_SALSN|nr:mitogen-activated protein kinase kinase kinase 17-like [Salvia splendens]KAG6397803.1 hypothetical protein SASPL_139251 [Salvia splendens]